MGSALDGIAAGSSQPCHDRFYLAQLCLSLQAVAEPGRIVIGGGVAKAPGLHGRVGAELARLGAGYFRGKATEMIVPPAFGDQAGLMGALTLAMDAFHDG